MADWFRKVKAGLVKAEIEDYVGEEGNLFFNIATGEIRLSDGVTPGGIPIVVPNSGGGGGGGGGDSGTIVVSNIDSDGIVTNPIPNVTTLRFDQDTFILSNLGGGQVKIVGEAIANIDGGVATSVYGGITNIDAGGI